MELRISTLRVTRKSLSSRLSTADTTNFSMEAIEQTFNGTVGFGNSVFATISRNGDLVSRLYLEIAPNELLTNLENNNGFITAYAGNSVVKDVELEIGQSED